VSQPFTGVLGECPYVLGGSISPKVRSVHRRNFPYLVELLEFDQALPAMGRTSHSDDRLVGKTFSKMVVDRVTQVLHKGILALEEASLGRAGLRR
jgi:hypothetical protein